MTFLTFDPIRLTLLQRSLEDLVHSLETCLRHPAASTAAPALQTVASLVRLQAERVHLAIRNIDDSPATSRTAQWIPARFEDTRGDGHDRPDSVRNVPVLETSIPHLLRRYREWARSTPHWWTQATTRDSTTSDMILRDLGTDLERSGELIDGLDSLELLVLGTSDLQLVESVWQEATDPARTSPDVALHRIQRLLDVVFEHRAWEQGIAKGSIDPVERNRREVEIRMLIARIVAPWQLDLTHRSDLAWQQARGAERLHQISALESAADTLMSGLAGAVRRSLADLPSDPAQRIARIESVARAIGTSLEVRRMSEIDRVHSSGIDTLHTILGALSFDGPWPFSLLVDAGADWLTAFLDTTDDRLRRATLESLTQRQILASIAVFAVLTSAVSRARVSTERSNRAGPTVSSNSSTSSVVPANLLAELRFTYQSIDNAAGRGQTLAQLTK